jgi:hypothetical protein
VTRIKVPLPRSARAQQAHTVTVRWLLLAKSDGETRQCRPSDPQGRGCVNTSSLLIFSARIMKIMGRIDKDTSDTGGEAEREEGAEAQECQRSGRQRGSGDSPKGQHRRKGKNERRAVVEAGGWTNVRIPGRKNGSSGHNFPWGSRKGSARMAVRVPSQTTRRVGRSGDARAVLGCGAEAGDVRTERGCTGKAGIPQGRGGREETRMAGRAVDVRSWGEHAEVRGLRKRERRS